MKRMVSTGFGMAVIGFATVAFTAQAPAPAQTATPNADSRKITVTGCLKADPSSPAPSASSVGTSGTAGTTAGTAGTTGTAGEPAPAAPAAPVSSDARFVLADAVASPAEPTPDSTAAAAPSAPTVGGSKQTYRLIANPAALGQHVGKKLELVGTIEEDAASHPSDAAAAGSDVQGPKLRVESGKVIAASCSQE